MAQLENRDAYQLANYMARAGIETRRWWRSGCHSHPAFNGFSSSPLPETRRLARSTIGLPYHTELPDDEMLHVVNVLGDFLASPKSR
jgi:dTDP-4-amino-4,6-dideoxygalactose transaminase